MPGRGGPGTVAGVVVKVAAAEQERVAARVAGHVRRLIAEGGLRRGAPLPSYRDLARELGVAYTTVKSAMDRLDEEGVVRRQRARGCYVNRELPRSGKPLDSIGIIFRQSRAQLFNLHYMTRIMKGLSDLRDVQADLHVFSLREDGFVTPRQVADHGVDGLVLLGVENDDFLRAVASWGVPAVVADYYAPGIPLDFVACDNAQAAERAVRAVLERGHRRLCYVDLDPTRRAVVRDGPPGGFAVRSSDMVERREAMLRVLSRGPAACRWEAVTLPAGRRVTAADCAAWRLRRELPEAILTCDEHVAAFLIRVLGEAGTLVPRDVSVCAVAGSDSPGLLPRAIAQCRFDFVGMGWRAAARLQERCAHPGLPTHAAVHRIGFEFMAGDTLLPRGQRAAAPAGGEGKTP